MHSTIVQWFQIYTHFATHYSPLNLSIVFMRRKNIQSDYSNEIVVIKSCCCFNIIWIMKKMRLLHIIHTVVKVSHDFYFKYLANWSESHSNKRETCSPFTYFCWLCILQQHLVYGHVLPVSLRTIFLLIAMRMYWVNAVFNKNMPVIGQCMQKEIFFRKNRAPWEIFPKINSQ